MTLTDKLSALLAVKESLLQTCHLPENLRGYSITTRIEESDKLLMEILKQIVEAKPIELAESDPDDNIPF